MQKLHSQRTPLAKQKGLGNSIGLERVLCGVIEFCSAFFVRPSVPQNSAPQASNLQAGLELHIGISYCWKQPSYKFCSVVIMGSCNASPEAASLASQWTAQALADLNINRKTASRARIWSV